MSEAATAFLEKLFSATQKVEDGYFHFPVQGGSPKHRERVYCYELYHRLRNAWPPTGVLAEYKVNGEVDKKGHPILAGLGLRKIPDFLIHVPGSDKNLAILEVKSTSNISKKEVTKDLSKLRRFVDEAGYELGVYLVYGDEEECKRVTKIAKKWCEEEEEQLDDIELLMHAASGATATKKTWE